MTVIFAALLWCSHTDKERTIGADGDGGGCQGTMHDYLVAMKEQRPTEIAPAEPPEAVEFPHETLDVYRVLDTAYQTVRSWQGISWSRGTGDQLQRALSGAILRYTEGYYADGGNKASLWRSARASIGEAATAVHILAVEGRAPDAEAAEVRSLLSRAMQMLARLLQPR